MIDKEGFLVKNFDEIKEMIQNNKQQLKDEYGVTIVGIFGSYVRGEQTEKSDVDMLVELEKPIGLIRFIQLERHISELLGIKVDLATKMALKPYIGRRILSEVRYV